ncbi:MAG: GNAT family N-acetyltransferase [Flavisolibacter sp.]
MLHSFLISYPELQTEKLSLRQIKREDAPELWLLRSHDLIMRYLDREKMSGVAEAEALIDKIGDSGKEGTGYSWALSLKNDEKMIGYSGIWRIDKVNHRGEIGYTLHPDYWNQGLMTEALRVIVNFGFDQLGLHSLEANVNPGNGASIRLLEKSGFVREAYFRENYFFRGNFLDSAIYSLISTDRR